MLDRDQARRAVRRFLSGLRLRCITPERQNAPASLPVAFIAVRNEMLRLPRCLDHYRALGVGRFYVVENNSTDTTAEYLMQQDDVCLYRTRETFVRKESWIDWLLRRHGRGRWCVVVDADELLDYPGRDVLGLAGFGEYLEKNDWNALHTLLLDLYPGGVVGETGYESGSDYFAMPWFFDPVDKLRRVPRHFWKGSGLDYRFEGGVRERVFGVSNCCSKFPFFRFAEGMFLHDGQHYLEGAHVAPLRGVLYHFKYLQDFVAHAREEVVRGQHWKQGAEYAKYAEQAQSGDICLHAAESVRYTGPQQMMDLNVMETTGEYAAFLAKAADR